ncbi:uncharacterized protein TrAtP1_004513 [Trichoderma atroviride]|uniref:uncharacterized protein n=1 Tax=Hypocrea atroviridis TaxID=63577 RepID=UPI003331A692|nr:hypothetical protein TrAtP1_004513 [Trichoderma atroviride]
MDDIQPEQAQPSPTIEPIRFRAGKKRKAYRQRGPAAEEQEDANDGVATAISPAPVMPGVSSKSKDVDAGRDADDTGAEAQNPTQGHSEREDNGDDGDDDNHTAEESAVAAALRLRNARRAASRRGGVGFRSEGRSAPGEEDDAEHALVLRDQDKEGTVAHDRIVGGITNRFMHQTGLLTILDDSHMNAYIESRLASRNASHAPPRRRIIIIIILTAPPSFLLCAPPKRQWESSGQVARSAHAPRQTRRSRHDKSWQSPDEERQQATSRRHGHCQTRSSSPRTQPPQQRRHCARRHGRAIPLRESTRRLPSPQNTRRNSNSSSRILLLLRPRRRPLRRRPPRRTVPAAILRRDGPAPQEEAPRADTAAEAAAAVCGCAQGAQARRQSEPESCCEKYTFAAGEG